MQTGARGKGKGAFHASDRPIQSESKSASFRCFVTVGRSLGCTFHGLIAIAIIISHEHEPFMNNRESGFVVSESRASSLELEPPPPQRVVGDGWVP